MKSLDKILSFLSGNHTAYPYLDEADIDVYYSTDELIENYDTERYERLENDY